MRHPRKSYQKNALRGVFCYTCVMSTTKVISYRLLAKLAVTFVLVVVVAFMMAGEDDESEQVVKQQKEEEATPSEKSDAGWEMHVSKEHGFEIQYPKDFYYIEERSDGVRVVNIFEENEYNRAYSEEKKKCEAKGDSSCSVYFSRPDSFVIKVEDGDKTLKQHADIYGQERRVCSMGSIKGLCVVAYGYTDPIPYFLVESYGRVIVFSNTGTVQKMNAPLPTVNPRADKLEYEKVQIMSTFRFFE